MKSAIKRSSTMVSPTTASSENSQPPLQPSYPLPAYLNFVPGGVDYDSVTSPHLVEDSHPQQLPKHWFLLNQMASPDVLVKRAHDADNILRKYALRCEACPPSHMLSTSSKDPLPHYLPSLSVLAEAAFAPLTGLQASTVRKWADLMVLAYLNDPEDQSYESIKDTDDLQLLQEYTVRLGGSPSSSNLPLRNVVQGDLPSVLKTLHSSHLTDQSSINQNDPASPNNNSYCMPVRPCGYVFRRGDIAWNCRTCQTDATCVICDTCFRASDHTGHEVFFHRTSPGGCCDCGDAEAWNIDGCCDRHRPRNVGGALGGLGGGIDGIASKNAMEKGEKGVEDDGAVDYEAVKASERGRKDGDRFVREMLPSRFAAALGVVIGAAVNTVLKAVDGAGIAADKVQWTRRWADQIRRIHDGRSLEEEYALRTNRSCVTSIGDAMNLKFPNRFRLQLRLHNDDVHTFDEVISALYERNRRNYPNGSHEDGNEIDSSYGLVSSRDDAAELTHHVDSDGQVVVRSYTTLKAAKTGFDRLKSKGLHCAVVSTPQVDLELRARLLVSWLTDISAANPAVSALVVHALADVTEGMDVFGGVRLWGCARMLPPWSFPHGYFSPQNDEIGHSQNENYTPGWRRRMDVFPPNLVSSYLTREEAMQLHQLGFTAPDDLSSPIISPSEFAEVRGADANFYSRVPYLLPSERFRKSPHSLWGTMPPPFATGKKCEHPILYRQTAGDRHSYNLLDRLLVLDTDLRKQQEADVLTSNLYPHKLLGLHMISGVGLTDVEKDADDCSVIAPTAAEWALLLSVSSYRAPISPLLLFLLLDPYPPKQLRGNLHSLFLSLIIDSRFKSRFAACLGAIAYRSLSTLFCSGVGTEADTPLGFTVQTFTVGSLVRALGNADATRQLLDYDGVEKEERNIGFQDVFTLPLAHSIVRCIHTNLLGATKEITMILKNTAAGNRNNEDGKFDNSTRNSTLLALAYQPGELPITTILDAAPDDGFLESRSMKHKRLPHLLRDLEYVLETPGTALRLLLPSPTQNAEFKSNTIAVTRGADPSAFLSFSAIFCRLLRLAQGMDPQKRKTSGGHVEYEQQRWIEAFSLTLNFSGARDALAESQTHAIPNCRPPKLEIVREGMGNLFISLVREIKWWLYKEGIWETGFPTNARGSSDALGATGQMEALQRSTLHVSSSSQVSNSTEESTPPIALSCATHIKMTESHLEVIENALRAEQSVDRNGSGRGTIMGDWLRVPHSPHGGACLSFHLPLHRSFARNVRSVCTMVVPDSLRDDDPENWWKIPVLDCDAGTLKNRTNKEIMEHPLSTLLRPALRTSNCRITWSTGPDCNSEEAQRRRSRSRAISAAIASAKVIHSICDHPLRCLAAAEQIMRHLWARNGVSAGNMALNYSTAPLCRDFRDLDLTMVQLSASGLSIGLGARRVFSLLLSRFNLDGYLCDPEKRSGNRNTSNSFGGAGWIKPQRLQDPDHAVPLAEALFSTICVLVTELPPPPPATEGDDFGLRIHVRRELLHALAAKPRSYSEAMTSSSTAFTRRDESESNSSGKSGEGTVSLRNLFSDVLGDIGKQKSQTSRSTDAPTFELLPEISDEYDPTFFHLRRSQHQHAMDNIARLRKLKISGNSKNDRNWSGKCLPIVCPPPIAHPRFLPCRLILHLPALDAAARRALLLAVTGGQWFPPQEPTNSNEMGFGALASPSDLSMSHSNNVAVPGLGRRSFNRSPSSLRVTSSFPGKRNKPTFSAAVVNASSVSFLEVLQILTLQVHTLEECAFLHSSHPTLDNENKSISAGLSINSYLTRLIHVPDSVVNEWALRPSPHGPLSSKGSGFYRGSILGLLIALYEHRSDNGNDSGNETVHAEDGHGGARFLVANGLKWLLRFVQSLVDGAQCVKQACESASSGNPVQNADSSGELGSPLWTIDPVLKANVSGMLRDLHDLWPKHDNERKSEDNSGLTAKGREARKAAQIRILKRMKDQQAKFAATVVTDGKSSYEGGKGLDEESDLCIICRCDDDDGENNGPLGYLGHVQRSRTLQLRSQFESQCREGEITRTYRVVGDKGCQVRQTEAMDSDPVACIPVGSLVQVQHPTVSEEYDLLSRRVFIHYVSPTSGKVVEGWASIQSTQGYVILSPLVDLCQANSRWGSTRPIIRQCGHAAHLGCVETHVASIHQKAQSESAFDGRFAADIEDGEFLCPLCKQLSNVVVPFEKHENQFKCIPVPRHTKKLDEKNSLHCLELDLLQDTLRSWPNNVASDKAKKKTIEQYGTYLYNAMQVFSWDTKNEKKKAKKKWHPALSNWDFEEGKGGVGSTLRLLRQQHIAWGAAGHSAATAEASSRGLKRIGFEPATSDPWADYNKLSRDSHPMLLELRRTLTAASSLYSVLCNEIHKSPQSVSLPGNLLSDIICGKFWSSLPKGSHASATNDAKVAEWSVLSALLSSTPCHVARDETLSAKVEARATAAAIWGLNGMASQTSIENNQSLTSKQKENPNPPTPLSVRLIPFAEGILKNSWGTMDPSKASETVPFRPALACGFLYIPFLFWDLNTLAGAVFSTILSSEDWNCHTLVNAARVLLVGRIIQVLITPVGFDENCPDSLDDMDTEFDLEKESIAITTLLHYSLAAINIIRKQTAGTETEIGGGKLLASVSFAILPFARTLILLLRASMSALRRNLSLGECDSKMDPIDSKLDNLLESDEAMFIEDGFYFLQQLGGPMPSVIATLISEGDNSWANLINRWLNAVGSLESYHGSNGCHLQFDADAQKWFQNVSPVNGNERLRLQGATVNDDVTSASEDVVALDFAGSYNLDTFGDDVSATENVEGDDDENMDEGTSSDETDIIRQVNGLVRVNDSDEDMEGANTNLVLDERTIGARTELHSESLQEENGDSDEASNADMSTNSLNREQESAINNSLYAELSLSAIIPYQPSFLGSQMPAGYRGKAFDYNSASSIMNDLSHLGMIHSNANSHGSGLIRLPRSFVELYGTVNQVKTSGRANSLDDSDDTGGGEAAICLVTGAIMRSGSSRRSFSRQRQRSPGSCTLHARKVGSGTGVFFLVQKCTVLLIHNKKSAYSASLYVDENGEEDTGLRRGRPLFLKQERYEALENLWRQHGIPREVAQIRSTSDRVIRENWY